MNTFTTDIIPRASIEALCIAFNHAAETARRVTAEMQAANQRIAQVWGEEPAEIGRPCNYYRSAAVCIIDETKTERAIRIARAHAWENIIERTGIKHLMSIKQTNALQQQLADAQDKHRTESQELPELTPENVYGWLAELHRNIPDMFTEAAREVFQLLTPQGHRDEYKTNEPNRQLITGRKIILTWTVEHGYRRGPRVRYGQEEKIRALGNVFSLLAGKGPQQYPEDLATRLNEWWNHHAGNEPYTDNFFRIRAYSGTGTMHIELLRPDLVTELNRRAAGMALHNPAA